MDPHHHHQPHSQQQHQHPFPPSASKYGYGVNSNGDAGGDTSARTSTSDEAPTVIPQQLDLIPPQHQHLHHNNVNGNLYPDQTYSDQKRQQVNNNHQQQQQYRRSILKSEDGSSNSSSSNNQLNNQNSNNNMNGTSNACPEIKVYLLQKSNHGMGLSIVATKGIGQDQLGIYVKTVVPGGAADLVSQVILN